MSLATVATGNGVKIQLWSYGGGTNQQWKPVQQTNGSWTFNPRNNTSECLDVTAVSPRTVHSCSNGRAPAAPPKASRLHRKTDASMP